MDNMTAKVSCFARAYHYKNNSIRIFTDDIAEKLLGEDYHQIAKSMSDGIDFFYPGFEGTREEGLRLILDRQLSPSVLDKHGFKIEEHLDKNDMTCRYFREYNQANPMHQMNAPVGVRVCICCKKIRQHKFRSIIVIASL